VQALAKERKKAVSLIHHLFPLQADAHESSTLDRIKEEEPEYYAMVSSVLKRAETEFAL
jgi:hypothetical protein